MAASTALMVRVENVKCEQEGRSPVLNKVSHVERERERFIWVNYNDLTATSL